MQIIFYVTATGEIDFVQEYDDDTTTLPGDVDADTPVGDSWIVGDGEATPELDYVLAGVQTERPVITTDFTLDAVADGTSRRVVRLKESVHRDNAELSALPGRAETGQGRHGFAAGVVRLAVMRRRCPMRH